MNGSVVLPLHEQSFPYLKTAGVLLREAREVKGLSQENVASALNLMTSHIAALESDSYNPQLEGKHFSSYLKSYAKFLGLNPQILLGLYQTQLKQPAQGATAYALAPEPSGSGIWMRISLVALLLTVAWTFDRGDVESLRNIVAEIAAGEEFRTVQAEQAATQTNTGQPAVSADNNAWTTPEWANQPGNSETEQRQVTNGVSDSISAASAGDDATNSLRTAVVVTPSDSKYQAYRLDVAEDHSATASAVLLSGASEDILLFNFHDNCWVEVYDKQQNPIVMDTKLQGETLRITGEAPFEVRVGNSRAVSLSLNGQPILIEQHPTIDSTELIVGRR